MKHELMNAIFENLLDHDHKFDPRDMCISLYAAASINFYWWSVYDAAILAMDQFEDKLWINDLGYLISALSMIWCDNYNQFLKETFEIYFEKITSDMNLKEELGISSILAGLTQLGVKVDFPFNKLAD